MPEKRSGKSIDLSANALVVLERRYLAKDVQGNVVETPEELFRRVARNIALAEEQATGNKQQGMGASPASSFLVPDSVVAQEYWETEFYELMSSLRFLPNSPTLGNAGRPLQQLSACFVLPVEDSMVSIFDAVKQTALIHQSGGGTGFAFSRLRPSGDPVSSSGGVASGPVSFMRVFDSATEAIKQGGTRRGANMAILDARHPDIEEFISLKGDMVSLTNFNISVAVDEHFMRAVESDAEYELVNPRTGEVAGSRRARAIFDQIVANAWRNGDPGLVFLDRINADNPTPALGAMEATNPCGEQPLLPYESCNLGSLNLARFVGNKQQATSKKGADGSSLSAAEVDWDALAEAIPVAVRFLDDVIDMNAYPVAEIAAQTRLTRKIGLGVMGFADMLFQLGVPYDSEEALQLADRLMAFIREHADAASEALAAERGVFPAWEESIYGLGATGRRADGQAGRKSSDPSAVRGERVEARDAGQTPRPSTSSGRTDLQMSSYPSPHAGRGPGGGVVRPFRNSTRTTVAPTGTLSIIADCSGGIEPAFALAFTRQHNLDPRSKKPVRLTEVNPVFEGVAKARGFYSRGLVEHLAAGGSLRELGEVPEDVRRLFVTAHEIEPAWHVRMQAAFQRHVDNAVSKTINFPQQATIGDVAEAYMLAYREGCKGITIYRDGSRTGQVLSHIADGEAYEPDPPAGEASAGSALLSLKVPDGRHRRRRGSSSGAGRQRRGGYELPRPALALSDVETRQPCLDCGNPLIFSEGCLLCRACGYTRCG
jgi:ribonucleoside-diphosphate reductase alpha chain